MSGFIHGESGWACNEKNMNTAPIPFIDSCDDCALEAWERQTTGGVTVSAEYRSQMVKVRLARGLMKRALAEQDRQLYLAIDRAEAALCS